MGSAFKDIQFELHDGVGRIVLNRPPVNVLNIAMMEEIQEALRAAQAGADPRGLALFPHVIGARKAAELILIGDAIPAEEAHRIGLINAVVPAEQLAGEANRIISRLTDKSAA